MKRNIVLMLLMGLFVASCGSPKETLSKQGKKMSPQAIFETYEKAQPDFETLNARLKGSFNNGKTRQSVNLSLRMKKNDTIWISAQKLGFTLAKLLVTPDGVKFYDKINGQYFDGDFSLLKDWLGVEIDFQNFQNLLLGRLLVHTDLGTYTLRSEGDLYTLSSRKKRNLLQLIKFDQQALSLREEHLQSSAIEESVRVLYPSYFTDANAAFPDKIDIIASKPKSETNISLRYRSLVLDEAMSFPFAIPEGYTQMKIKK